MILRKNTHGDVGRFIPLLGIFISLLVLDVVALGEPAADLPPDFTTGGQRGESHDWLLGPTGMRGWMYFRHEDLTAASRQILVTEVEKDSPADGIVKYGDVILGVFGKPFESDARRSFGHAIAAAEEKTGILPLTIWRDGKSSNVELKLQVLGAYSATAPYDCPKSRNIFEQGCRLIAEKGFENADIPDHLNALALLASGDKKHHSALREYAGKAAQSVQSEDTWNWYIAYANLFLSEYTLATGKKSAFSELKKTTMRGVKNQCKNGMWGHAPALPNGHSEGYGGMNVIGLPMTISFLLAREAGVDDPDLDKAIDKSAKFLRYYVDKGTIPYGDHPPGANVHEDNGKSSCAAVLFDLRNDRDGTEFFSRMATAAYDQREQGHCGNFWNMLWALPGVSRSGPNATGAYLREQAWYYDLSRNWKGGFVYQKIVEGEENDNYTNWDLTGGYLLSFGLYQKNLHILGKKPSVAPTLDAQAVQNVIVAGRDRYPEGVRNGYNKRPDEILLEGLASWSPAMRYNSAKTIGARGGNFTPLLIEMLEGNNRNARYGAVEALGRLGRNGESALPHLHAALQDPDTWLQCLAAEALARIGDKSSAGELLGMALRPSQSDSRRMHQRAASRALFSPYPGNSEPVSLLADSLDGVNRDQLHLVMKSLLENDDSVVRASVIPTLRKLNNRELAPLLPTLVSAVETLAPTNEMWGDDIRQSGLDILSSRHIREGMLLCVSTIEWRWGLQIQPRMNYLSRYGKHALEVVPNLKKLVRELEKREEGGEPSENRNILIKAIADIEASKEEPEIVTLKDFIARAMGAEKPNGLGKKNPKAGAKPLKVFILAGQSNMEGHGGIQTLDQLGKHPTQGHLLKKIKKADGSFVVRDDVFVSYKKEGEHFKRPLSVGMGAWGPEWFGPEVTFGIEMGDHFKEPILLIKTCWGGHSLYGNFRPPSAGKAGYETGHQPEDIGASYHKMIGEVRECIANLDSDFPQLKGRKPELSGFVWFQGWNDICADESIRQQVYDEYCPNFVHLVQDLRAEFKVPNLPVVVGELGVGGEKTDQNMIDFRAAQAKIAKSPELKGTIGYVRTAPFWYSELDELPAKMQAEESRVRTETAEKLNKQMKNNPDSEDPKKMEELIKAAGDKALEEDRAYQKAKKEYDQHVCNWYCHYQGSARVYAMVGYSLAEAMKPLLETKR